MPPAQRLLALPAFGIILGSFLTWINTPLRSYTGFEGAGRFTFYLGVLALGAAFLPLRRVAAVQGGLAVIAAGALGTWQIVNLVDLVGFQGWMPGPGLILILLSTAVGLYCSLQMLAARPLSPLSTS